MLPGNHPEYHTSVVLVTGGLYHCTTFCVLMLVRVKASMSTSAKHEMTIVHALTRLKAAVTSHICVPQGKPSGNPLAVDFIVWNRLI